MGTPVGREQLSYVAATLVATILLAVEYADFRVAASRFGASPYRDAAGIAHGFVG